MRRQGIPAGGFRDSGSGRTELPCFIIAQVVERGNSNPFLLANRRPTTVIPIAIFVMLSKLNKLIADTLKIDESLVNDDASMQTLPQWDSLAHMNLVAALESQFSVRFEPEDLLSMVSVQEILNALARFGVSADSEPS